MLPKPPDGDAVLYEGCDWLNTNHVLAPPLGEVNVSPLCEPDVDVGPMKRGVAEATLALITNVFHWGREVDPRISKNGDPIAKENGVVAPP